MNTIFLAIIFNHYVDLSKKGKKNKTKKKTKIARLGSSQKYWEFSCYNSAIHYFERKASCFFVLFVCPYLVYMDNDALSNKRFTLLSKL